MGTEVLIVDLETLDQIPSSAILAFAAIACDWNEVSDGSIETLREKSFYRTLNVKDQVERLGRTTSGSTIDWWRGKQEAYKFIQDHPNKIYASDLPTEFAAYCEEMLVDKDTMVICRGQDFDFPIIADLYRSLDAALPYNNWAARDIRTMIDLAFGTSNGYVPGFKNRLQELNLIEHYAVDDCIKDLLQTKAAIEKVWS